MKRGSMCCCYERDRESVRERKRFEKEKLSNLIFFFFKWKEGVLRKKREKYVVATGSSIVMKKSVKLFFWSVLNWFSYSVKLNLLYALSINK